MKRPNRIWFHLAFWLIYYLIYVFNELFISPSFSQHPSMDLALGAFVSQGLILSIKVPITYVFLYLLLPWWLAERQKFKVLATAFLCLLVFAILQRIMIQRVIWPYVYEEGARDMAHLQQIARVIYSSLDILQIVALAVAVRLFRMRLKAYKTEKALVQEKLQSEILHLKSQINPHFLFNSLNSIYALARSKSDHTPETVMRLSKIMRYVIYETGKSTVAVGDELKIAKDYIELQQIRFGKRVDLEMEVEIDEPGGQITPLLILPLLENAFKHGTEGNPGTISILVRIKLQEGKLRVETRNPVGKPPGNGTAPGEEPQSGEGIGLTNIRRQLELLYRDFELRHGKEGGEFAVHLYIDLSTYAGTQLLDR